MALADDGKLFVANFDGASIDIYEGTNYAKHHRLPACQIPRHLALSPDEKTLYVSCYHSSALEAIDVSSERVTRHIPIGESPKTIEVSPDGRYVFSADYGTPESSISIVDTADWRARVFPIPGLKRGSGISVMKDGRHALVTGWIDNHVYLVGLEPRADSANATIRRATWEVSPSHGAPSTGATLLSGRLAPAVKADAPAD
jgi:YVTN family beta-propeller protein